MDNHSKRKLRRIFERQFGLDNIEKLKNFIKEPASINPVKNKDYIEYKANIDTIDVIFNNQFLRFTKEQAHYFLLSNYIQEVPEVNQTCEQYYIVK